jgi:outer membrane protein OmpA-like peptidoglycan-associated protein
MMANPHCQVAKLKARPGGRALTLLLVVVLAMASAPGVRAQRAVEIGRGGAPSVSIDLSVLDELGPAPNVASLLRREIMGPQMPLVRGPAQNLPSQVLRRPGIGRQDVEVVRLRPPAKAAKKRRPVVKRPPPAATGATAGGARRLTPSKPPATPRKSRPPPPATPKIAAPAPPPPPPPPQIARVPAAPKPPVAAAPAKPPAAAAPTAKKPTPAKPVQTASLPPAASGFGPGRSFRIGFAAGQTALSDEATKALARVVEGMKTDPALRLRLLAFAGGSGTTASQSRRLSLTRALQVRSYLIDNGVRSTRIDVRALGNKFQGGPPDRVDVNVTTR